MIIKQQEPQLREEKSFIKLTPGRSEHIFTALSFKSETKRGIIKKILRQNLRNATVNDLTLELF